MSWWLHVFPLHCDGAYQWARAEAGIRRVPAEAPDTQPYPVVRDVLQAFREAGCHGDPWFRVEDLEPGAESAACLPKYASGLYLGEMTLHATDRTAPREVLQRDTPIHGIGFRKPSPDAVLHAMCALAPKTGPLVVVDDACEGLVVLPGDQPNTVAEHWPW